MKFENTRRVYSTADQSPFKIKQEHDKRTENARSFNEGNQKQRKNSDWVKGQRKTAEKLEL